LSGKRKARERKQVKEGTQRSRFSNNLEQFSKKFERRRTLVSVLATGIGAASGFKRRRLHRRSWFFVSEF
jgi:hypothetical protein